MFTVSEPYVVGYAESTEEGVLRFTATDLDGNPLSSEEIFSQHKMTMVNIWATWCGPCVGELGELQKIHTKFLEKDCAIVGLMTDKDIDEARRLMKENGITYLVVLAPDNIDSAFPYEGIPTSFFVDQNGVIRGKTITGAYPNLYESGLEQAMEAAQ